MGKAKVHVSIPHVLGVACGEPGYNATPSYRHLVTCEKCKAHPLYKTLRLDYKRSKSKGMKSQASRRDR